LANPDHQKEYGVLMKVSHILICAAFFPDDFEANVRVSSGRERKLQSHKDDDFGEKKKKKKRNTSPTLQMPNTVSHLSYSGGSAASV